MYFLCYPQVVSSHAYSYGFISCLWDFFHHPNVIEVSGILFLVLTAGEEKTFSYGIFLKWKVIPVKTVRKNNRDTVSEKYNLLLLYCGGGWNLTRTGMGFDNLEPNPEKEYLQPEATTFKWKQATFCHLVFSSGAIVKTFFPYSTWQNASFFIHLLYNGDVKADRNGAGLPAGLDGQSGFIFQREFVPGGKKNCILSQSTRRWCQYSTATTWCNHHFSHNDTLEQNTLLLLV